MTQRSLPLLALLLITTPVLADGKIATRIDSSTEDGETFSNLGFADASCEEECHTATFSCSSTGAITIELADIDAKHAAAAIQKENKQVLVSVGGKSFDYFIQEMQYQEMTGSWWLISHTLDENARELAPAIAKAKSIEAVVDKQKIVLPVDANVKKWAAACK
jgi:hypothetical protein